MPRQPKEPQQPKRKKSAYGGGSVYPLKDGRYASSIKDPNSGRRIVRYAKTQKEAEKKLEDIKFEIRQNTLATGPRQTVEQYLTSWLEDVQKHEVEQVSYIKQKRILRKHLRPAFGHLQLKSLTASISSSCTPPCSKKAISQILSRAFTRFCTRLLRTR